MDTILNFIKKIIPKRILKEILPAYHIGLAYFAALWYGHPSEKMILIGVTGTNGKSTTTELIARVLNYANQCECESELTRKYTTNCGNMGGRDAINRVSTEQGNYKVGFTSTVKFKVGDKEWLNDKKMTMVGRFQLQKLLRDMVKAGCKYAVIETSSEGVKQFRHKAINYDYLVFTNLTPEHIESHGSFENYKDAKLELFRHLEISKRKRVSSIKYQVLSNEKLRNKETKKFLSESQDVKNKDNTRQGKILPNPPLVKGGIIPKVIIVNGDDKYANEFLNFKVDEKIIYKVEQKNNISQIGCGGKDKAMPRLYGAENIALTKNGTSFQINCTEFKLNLLGLFNVYNAMPAIIIGENEGMDEKKIKEALADIKVIPGRMEFIDAGQPFMILVDYAPEPESMRKLYEAIGGLGIKFKNIIHVLGSCGGGRDKARRPILGSIAAENADYIIITNEDPYDDDPVEIIEDVASGVTARKQENIKTLKQEERELEIEKLAANVLRHSEPRDEAKNPEARGMNKVSSINSRIFRSSVVQDDATPLTLFKILDRREAIRKALQLAKEGDLVIITGKGSEQAMCVANGKKISWDDRKVVREEIRKLRN